MASIMTTFVRRALGATALLDLLQPLVLLALRLYVSSVFFRSGLVKVSDWGATLGLFHDVYKVPLLPPDVAAVASACGELGLPVLVTLGLAGRFGAAGLFVVNAMAVISYPMLWEFDCPAAIQSHFMWGTILAALVVFGPGRLSLDELVLRRSGLRTPRFA
jgi:putative oxidoreductase